MQRDEGITLIFSGKAVAVIKGDLQGRGMRLNKNIWNCDLVLKVWPLALMMRVFIAANVEPRPSIDAPSLTCVAYSSGTSSPVSSRSLTAHHSSPVAGCTVKPVQLRKPVAKIFSSLPSGVNESTSARRSSVSHAAPSGLVFFQAFRPPSIWGSGNMSCATFEPEPTARNMRLPSGEKTRSRIQ